MEGNMAGRTRGSGPRGEHDREGFIALVAGTAESLVRNEGFRALGMRRLAAATESSQNGGGNRGLASSACASGSRLSFMMRRMAGRARRSYPKATSSIRHQEGRITARHGVIALTRQSLVWSRERRC